MSATNGRSDYHSAILLWRWRPGALHTRQVAGRLPPGYVPTWIAVVPPVEDAPPLPAAALRFALSDGDTAWVW